MIHACMRHAHEDRPLAVHMSDKSQAHAGINGMRNINDITYITIHSPT